MTNRFLKVYTWIVGVIAVLNIIGGILIVTTSNPSVYAWIALTSMLELAGLILSFVVILYIFFEDLDLMYAVLPIVYVIFSIGLFAVAILLKIKGIDAFDFTHPPALVSFIVNTALYVFYIGWGIYIYRRKTV